MMMNIWKVYNCCILFSTRRCRKAIPVATSAYLENLPSHYTQNVHLNQVRAWFYVNIISKTREGSKPSQSMLLDLVFFIHVSFSVFSYMYSIHTNYFVFLENARGNFFGAVQVIVIQE